MELEQFSDKLKSKAYQIGIVLTDDECEKFYKYMELLCDWNTKINLTAIIEPDDIIVKHFVDSLTIKKYVKKSDLVIDIGTGAGFPGIPLEIVNSCNKIVLADSLNKRINFLNVVKESINLENIETIHGRAEELAQSNKFRETFDIATSRAVAPLNVLLEYMLPFVKIGGKCICMKGANIREEIQAAENALNILGGKIVEVDEFNLPETDNTRNIVIIEKTRETNKKYPRKAGTPSKEPL